MSVSLSHTCTDHAIAEGRAATAYGIRDGKGRRAFLQCRRCDHAVDQGSTPTARLIEQAGGHGRLVRCELPARPDDRRRQVQLGLGKRPAEKLRPSDRAHLQGRACIHPRSLRSRVSPRAARESESRKRSSCPGGSSVLVCQPVLIRLAFRGNLAFPMGDIQLASPHGSLQSVEGIERAVSAPGHRGRMPNRVAQHLRFRHAPTERQLLQRSNRLDIERVGRLDSRYGHTRKSRAVYLAQSRFHGMAYTVCASRSSAGGSTGRSVVTMANPTARSKASANRLRSCQRRDDKLEELFNGQWAS